MKLKNKKAAIEWVIKLIVLIIVFLVIAGGLYFLIKFLTKW